MAQKERLVGVAMLSEPLQRGIRDGIRRMHALMSHDILRPWLITLNPKFCVEVFPLAWQHFARYWCTLILQDLFKRRAAGIDEAVRQNTSRFIVSESVESELTKGSSSDKFPWNLPVVFEAGTYRVHAAKALTSDAEHEQPLSIRSSSSRVMTGLR